MALVGYDADAGRLVLGGQLGPALLDCSAPQPLLDRPGDVAGTIGHYLVDGVGVVLDDHQHLGVGQAEVPAVDGGLGRLGKLQEGEALAHVALGPTDPPGQLAGGVAEPAQAQVGARLLTGGVQLFGPCGIPHRSLPWSDESVAT
ncbi:MAG TPA: hypothetical protein VM263_03950, partial [Acidimicrobiales bacterium]|nr:hypothetical protein [Acidimicrobiales bacterium]